jgi:5-methylcytosine-specific restriction endonuclease McrA
MTTLGLIANLVTENTLDHWLERIRGKTQREVEAIAATVRPPMTLRDRARLVQVAVPVASPLPLDPKPAVDESEKMRSPLPLLAPPPREAETNLPSIIKVDAPIPTQSKVYIQFLADQSFMSKYRVAAALLSNRLPRLTFEGVFGALIDDFVQKHGPVERHERREKIAARAQEAIPRTPVPVRTRDAVFSRDHGRCTFVGSDGKRCEETIRLNVDHIKPVARGGSNDITNLRLLCAKHNQLQAEKIFGRRAMSRFRDDP